MIVALTGGTGFVGRKLVQRLLKESHELRLLVRDPASAERKLGRIHSFYQWDAEKEHFPTAALEGADALIHLAGESVASGRWTKARKKAIRDSRVQSSRALMLAVRELAGRGPKVILSASAVGFYGDRGDEMLTETSLPGQDFLASVCQEWEEEILKPQLTGVRQAALRFGMVLGPDGGALARILPVFKMGLGGKLGSGKQWVSWIHREDLISLIHFALRETRAQGVILATSPQPVTNAEFTRVIARELGRPAILPVPGIGLKLAFGEMAEVLLSSQRAIPEKAQSMGFRFQYPDLESAIRNILSEESEEGPEEAVA